VGKTPRDTPMKLTAEGEIERRIRGLTPRHQEVEEIISL